MKPIFFFLFVLFLTSCTTQVNVNKEEENAAVVQAMFEAFNAHDWEKMASYYAENAQFLDPSFGTEYIRQSRNEIAAKYQEMETSMPDIRDNLVGVYPSGDKVVVEFVSSATLPDGSKMALPIATIFTIENGLIVKDATYYNNAQ